MERMLLILLLLSAFTPADLYRTLPAEIRGWKAAGEDMQFDRETLFRHINGGAELYLTYDFREVIVRRFEHQDKPGILLEVYDMGSSAEAFGIYSCERDGDSLAIGQDAEYAGGLLRLWKDRYFVSITSLGDETFTRDAIIALGTFIADRIEATGSYPALLEKLPAGGLERSSIRYFHAAQSLNNIYFLASENILLLGKDTNCLFARYNSGDEGCFLLLVEYPSDVRAREAFDTVITHYMPEAAETGYARMEDGTFTGIQRTNRFLVMIFESPAVETAATLLSGVNCNE